MSISLDCVYKKIYVMRSTAVGPVGSVLTQFVMNQSSKLEEVAGSIPARVSHFCAEI